MPNKITTILLALILSSNLFPQEKIDFFSAANRLKFGDYLYRQKDYLRAFDEYSAYLKTHGNDTMLLKMSLALREMKRYSEAEDYLKSLAFNSPLKKRAKIELFKTYFIKGGGTQLKNEFERKRYVPENGRGAVLSLYYVSQILWSQTLPDSVNFIAAFEPDIREKMENYYYRKKYPGYKDETTAGILSAAIPGLGKIYNEDYGDGITAFIFTSVLGYLTYDNFRAGHTFRAWLFAGLTGLFHGGNIYGSIVSARLYNAKTDAEYEKELFNFVKEENYFDNNTSVFHK